MVGNEKYDVMLEARVQSGPGFKNGTFKIPIKVSIVKISDDSLREKLEKVRTLYYDGHVLPISQGDRIRAYGSVDQILKEAKPQRIEQLDDQGSIIRNYDRSDAQ